MVARGHDIPKAEQANKRTEHQSAVGAYRSFCFAWSYPIMVELKFVGSTLVPAPKVAQQFYVTRRTLSRWLLNPALGFPKPTVINNRLYFNQTDVDAWKTERACVSLRELA